MSNSEEEKEYENSDMLIQGDQMIEEHYENFVEPDSLTEEEESMIVLVVDNVLSQVQSFHVQEAIAIEIDQLFHQEQEGEQQTDVQGGQPGIEQVDMTVLDLRPDPTAEMLTLIQSLQATVGSLQNTIQEVKERHAKEIDEIKTDNKQLKEDMEQLKKYLINNTHKIKKEDQDGNDC